MPVSDLQRMSLDEFITEHRDQHHLWLLLHLPKTGGSSLGTELRDRLRPHFRIHQTTPGRRERNTQLGASIDRFLSEARDKPFRFVAGHMDMEHADRIKAAIPNTKVITMLRDPVDRVISDYRYHRGPQHALHEEFARRFPTIERFVSTQRGQNLMYRMLGGRVGMSLQDVIAWMESNLTFVAILEKYEMSFDILSRMLGIDAAPTVYKNKTVAEGGATIDTKLRERIRRLNKLDVALYEHFRDLLSRHESAWRSKRELGAPDAG